MDILSLVYAHAGRTQSQLSRTGISVAALRLLLKYQPLIGDVIRK